MCLSVQLRNPDITHGLFRRQLKRHLSRAARTRRFVTSDMRRLRKKHLLTYVVVVVDFLLVLIELFSLDVTAEELRANISWGQVDPKFQVEGVAPHQPFFFSEN